jgi:amidohydrolase
MLKATTCSTLLMLGLFVTTTAAQAVQKPREVIPLSELPSETNEITEMKRAVESQIDALSPRMFEMNDWMYHNPEVGHEEVEAARMLSSELEAADFEVTFGVPGLDEAFNQEIINRYDADGMPTAFVAKHRGSSEYPVIAFVFEVDALRADPAFHGCQHNQQGASMVTAAIALSNILEENNLPGSVWAIHTPAEEIPPPTKAAMVEAGLFDDVDFVIRSHGTGSASRRVRGGLGNCCLLIEAASYEFTGKPAHGASPWSGHDALDAARIFFNAVDAFREHNKPSFRFMGTITEVGNSPNVINEHVQVDHWVRNADVMGRDELDLVAAQVDTIAMAAAMATFTEVEIRHYGSYYNGTESAWMQALAWQYVNEYGDADAISDQLGSPVGWDEAGLGSVMVPGLYVRPAVSGVPSASGHSHENAAITVSPEGHRGLQQTAQIGAVMGLRLLTNEEIRDQIKLELEGWQQWGVQEGLIPERLVRR